MELTLTATFIQEGPENGFTGWIDEIPGVIAYGDSFEKAKSELMKMLSIKMKLERERAKEAPHNVIKEEFKFTPA